MFWVLGFLLFNSIFSQQGLCESEIQPVSKEATPRLLKFNTTNNILLKGEINEETTSKFIYDLNLIQNKNNTVVYLNTPGGSVQHGMKIVSEVEKYNLSCVAEAAGFLLLRIACLLARAAASSALAASVGAGEVVALVVGPVVKDLWAASLGQLL